MANSNPTQDTTPQPGQIPETTPSNYRKAVGDAWIAESLHQTQATMQNVHFTLGSLSADIRQVKSSIDGLEDSARSDFRLTWGGIIAAVLVAIGAMLTAYTRLDDQISSNSNALAKIETRLDDLLQRVPPVPAPPQRR